MWKFQMIGGCMTNGEIQFHRTWVNSLWEKVFNKGEVLEGNIITKFCTRQHYLESVSNSWVYMRYKDRFAQVSDFTYNFQESLDGWTVSDQLEDYHLISHTLQQCRQYNGWTCTPHLVRICRHTQHKLINKVRHMTLKQKWTEKSEMLAFMHITGSHSNVAFLCFENWQPANGLGLKGGHLGSWSFQRSSISVYLPQNCLYRREEASLS